MRASALSIQITELIAISPPPPGLRDRPGVTDKYSSSLWVYISPVDAPIARHLSRISVSSSTYPLTTSQRLSSLLSPSTSKYDLLFPSAIDAQYHPPSSTTLWTDQKSHFPYPVPSSSKVSAIGSTKRLCCRLPHRSTILLCIQLSTSKRT